jgi:hypothetical protein
MNPTYIQDNISVAGLSTNDNVLTSKERFMRAPYDAGGFLMANISLADLDIEFYSDGQAITDQNTLRVGTTLLSPDDTHVSQFFIRKNGLMVLKGVNRTAGAKLLQYRIGLTPIETQEEIVPRLLITQRGPLSLAAGATIPNVLDNLRFERTRIDSLLDVLATASAVGLLMETLVEGNSVSEAVSIQAANRLPTTPYDMVFNDVEVPTDKRIEIRVNNPTGGPISFNFRTELQEQDWYAP